MDELNLPAPPTAQTTPQAEDGGATFTTATMSLDDMDTIPDGPEAMPRGLYHFRLESYKKKEKNGQPNFDVTFNCQQEPDTGRKTFDTIPWVNQGTIDDASNVSSPNHATARKIVKDRVWKINQLRKAAGYRGAGGSFDPETFFSTNPEVKIDLDQEERMEKDPAGNYTKPTGTFRNRVKKYLPLV